jgi:hypothetical protein
MCEAGQNEREFGSIPAGHSDYEGTKTEKPNPVLCSLFFITHPAGVTGCFACFVNLTRDFRPSRGKKEIQ